MHDENAEHAEQLIRLAGIAADAVQSAVDTTGMAGVFIIRCDCGGVGVEVAGLDERGVLELLFQTAAGIAEQTGLADLRIVYLDEPAASGPAG